MTEMTIQLTDNQFAELSERARQAGLPPGDQLQAEVEGLFDTRRQRIQGMIRDVVRDHRALFERLA